jgi:A/G-specific adenine glycosylase
VPDTALADAVTAWYRTAARDLPWRRPGTTPWGVLVSEVMLQQTPVARVVGPWQEWLARWPAPASLAAEEPGEAVRAWGRLGYPRRALRLHAAATACVERHGARGVVADPGQGQELVHRPRQLRAVEGVADAPVTRRDLALVLDLLPQDDEAAATASVALMELGALVCTARSPRHASCPVADRCAWLAAGAPALDGPVRRPQAYAGTDRQVRGRLLGVLRDSAGPVPAEVLARVWDEPVQRARALDGLVADGLVDPLPDGGYALPSRRASG